MNILQQALEYHDAGFSVIPRPLKTKADSDKWKQYQTKRASREQIEKWFTNSDKNIAIVCGAISGLVIVDLDSPEAISEYMSEYTTLRSRTGVKDGRPAAGRGYHLWFSITKDQQVKSWSENGLDVIAEGKYFIAPPSTHPSGVEYEFVDNSPIIPLPDEFIKAPYSDDKIPESVNKNWITDLFTNGFSPGRHNDQTFQLSVFYAKRNVPYDVTLALLRRLDRDDATPQGPEQVRMSVRSAYDTINPSGVYRIQTLDVLLENEEVWELRWLIEDWLPAASIGIIGALPQTGKTWFSVDLAVSLATGAPFLGSKVIETCKVLYIQLEDPMGMTLQKFRTIRSKNLDKFKGEENIHVLEFGTFNFGKPETISFIGEYVQEHDIGYVIVDPLVVTMDTRDFMASIGSDLKESVRPIRDELNCGFLFIHHVRKSSKNADMPEQEDLWGAVFVPASFETKIMMKGLKPDGDKNIRARVSRAFKSTSSAIREDLMLTFVINSTPGEENYEVIVQPYDSDVSELDDNQIRSDIIDLLRSSGPFWQRHLSNETGHTRGKINYWINQLLADGTIQRNAEGNGFELAGVIFIHEEEF